MYQFKNQDSNAIEILLGDGLTVSEYKSMTEQIESLPANHINIIFDTTDLHDRYTFKVFLDQYNFFEKYQSQLERVVFISDDEKEIFLLQQYDNNVEPEFKTYSQIEAARKWLAH